MRRVLSLSILILPLAAMPAMAQVAAPGKRGAPPLRLPGKVQAAPLRTPTALRVPGGVDAASERSRLARESGLIKSQFSKLPRGVPATWTDGIHNVNGKRRSVMEPGGAYTINGRGFGVQTGTVMLETGGKRISLKVDMWLDDAVLVTMPSDTSGLPDGPAKLTMGFGGRRVETDLIAFRAARADVPLPLRESELQNVSNGARPDRVWLEGEWLKVSRRVVDKSHDEKRCIEPGKDRVTVAGALRPGFEVTGWSYRIDDPAPWASSDGTATLRGAWGSSPSARSIDVDFAVLRTYYNAGMALLAHGNGMCDSNYAVRAVVTGPRGISPRP